MIDYKYFELFRHKDGSVDKEWKIEYDGGSFTDWDMFSESIELTESLCAENELRFGTCEASCLKFKAANIVRPLINEWITLSVVIDHHKDEPLIIGRYKVVSENLTADRQYKDIVAYDAMYDILAADMAEWYNTILPNKGSTVTMKQFRTSFIHYFGMEQKEYETYKGRDGEYTKEIILINDDMVVEKTIEPEQISGKDIITAICEVNGCFGHIGRDGKFHYIYLPQAIQGLYPANDLYPDHAPDYLPYQQRTGHLYPQAPKGTNVGAETYIECHYEDYITKPITKLQIRQEENDIGKIWPETPLSEKDNCYIIQDNFLVYGKSSEQLTVIAQNILGKITDIVYRPFDVDALGNPCFEVGDPVKLPTKYEIVESYILERTLKGIQALRDTFQAKGVEKYVEEVNGIHRSIVQLKGKANILTRTLEETKLEMYDIEKELSNTITVTAKDIRAELKNTADGLTNTINITAGQIRTELQNEVDGLNNTISVTAKDIKAELKNTKESLETQISITAGNLEAKLLDTSQDLQTQITANAEGISLKVSRDSLISEINQSAESVTIKAQKIDLQGLVTASEFTSHYATIESLNAAYARIDSLDAEKASIGSLEALEAYVDRIEADYVSVGNLEATSAELSRLIAGRATVEELNAVKANFNNLNADNITSGTLNVDRLSADQIVGVLHGKMITLDRLTSDTVNCDRLVFEGESVHFSSEVVKDSNGNNIVIRYLTA